MQRRFASAVSLVALAIGSAACSDQVQQSPASEPSATGVRALSAVKSGLTCSFTSMNPLVSHYFGGTTVKQTVSNLISAMQTAYSASDTTTTRDRGYDVMTYIAGQVKAGNPDYQDASSLTNALLACMLFSTAELPQAFPEDFTVATNPAADGGYDVRGEPPTDPDSSPVEAVYSRPSTFNTLGVPTHYGFSGMAPVQSSLGFALGWSQVIRTTHAPTRVLLYGRPGSNSQSYDWRPVPRTVSYFTPGGAPGVIVGLCMVGTSTLVHETGNSFTGFNPYADAYFLDPALCQSFAIKGSRWNPMWLAGKLFGVRPVWGNPGGVGGTTYAHSQYDGDQTQMTATFSQQPPANVQVCTPVSGQPNAGCPSTALFQVALSTTGAGTRADGTQDTGPVGPASVHLTAFNNNGTFGLLCELVPPADTTFVCDALGDTLGTSITQSSGGPPGFTPATFPNLFLTKTGAIKLVANGAITDRTITAQSISNKVNVKP